MWYENKWTVYLYFTLLAIMYVGFLLVFLGWNVLTFQQLMYLRMGIQILIAGVLLFKFHPGRKHYLGDNDATFIFGSSTFLIANVILEFIQKNSINFKSKL